jgi:hypothetical protein
MKKLMITTLLSMLSSSVIANSNIDEAFRAASAVSENTQTANEGLFSQSFESVYIVLTVIVAFPLFCLYVMALIRNPIYIARVTLGVVIFILSAFGLILFTLPNPLISLVGLVVAYYVSAFVGGWKNTQ